MNDSSEDDKLSRSTNVNPKVVKEITDEMARKFVEELEEGESIIAELVRKSRVPRPEKTSRFFLTTFYFQRNRRKYCVIFDHLLEQYASGYVKFSIICYQYKGFYNLLSRQWEPVLDEFEIDFDSIVIEKLKNRKGIV